MSILEGGRGREREEEREGERERRGEGGKERGGEEGGDVYKSCYTQGTADYTDHVPSLPKQGERRKHGHNKHLHSSTIISHKRYDGGSTTALRNVSRQHHKM